MIAVHFSYSNLQGIKWDQKESDVYKIYIDSYPQYSILAVVILAFAKELVAQHAPEIAKLLTPT
jgi:hypothetical protein